jgi:membrane protein YdbS with pleckstrin-like domain
MFSIDKHLSPHEKLIKKFRPSRIAYVHHYVPTILLLVISLFFSFYNEPGTHRFVFLAFVNLLSTITAVLCALYLLRLEYVVWSHRYALTTKRAIYSKGLFSETFTSTQYTNITDIGMRQTLLDKLLRTGNLYINTAGSDGYEIHYHHITQPLRIKGMLQELQHKGKLRVSAHKNGLSSTTN